MQKWQGYDPLQPSTSLPLVSIVRLCRLSKKNFTRALMTLCLGISFRPVVILPSQQILRGPIENRSTTCLSGKMRSCMVILCHFESNSNASERDFEDYQVVLILKTKFKLYTCLNTQGSHCQRPPTALSPKTVILSSRRGTALSLDPKEPGSHYI